jgi:hypothetical protein
MRFLMGLALLPVIIQHTVTVAPVLVIVGVFAAVKYNIKMKEEDIWNDPERW